MKLSICMMVKNEEKNLERCLNSLQQLMKATESELIIIDTGSEDRTVNIAKKYTDKVYFHPWNNNFSDMRNITISYAKGEWVLIVDADEELEDASGIIEFLNSDKCSIYEAGGVTIKSIIREQKESGINYGTTVRLFKNGPSLIFSGAIHEATKIEGKALDLKTIFLHYGYSADDEDLKERKFQRNIELLQKEIEEHPDNIDYRFYISIQYSMHSDYDKALNEASQAYQIIKKRELDPKKYLFLFSQLTSAYLANGKREEARRICAEGIKLEDEHIDLHYFLAKIEAEDKNYEEAVKHYKKYLYLCQNYENLKIKLQGMSRFSTLNRFSEVYLDLAYIYLKQKEYDLSLEYLQNVKLNEYFERTFGIFVELCINAKWYEKLYDYYKDVVTKEEEQKTYVFITILETYKEKINKEEQLQLTHKFSAGEDFYSIYNKMFLNLIKNISKDNISGYIEQFYEKGTINYDLASKMLCGHLLETQELEDKKYSLLFEKYIESGINFVEKFYGSDINEDEKIVKLINKEDASLIYIKRALQNGKREEFAENIKKAITAYPKMNRGIKLLLKNLT